MSSVESEPTATTFAEPVESRIDIFLSWFASTQTAIASLQTQGEAFHHSRIIKKLCLLSLLDSAAGFWTAGRDLHLNNKDRFTRFVEETTHWNGAKMISLAKVARSRQCFSKELLQYAKSGIERAQIGTADVSSTTVDVSLEQIREKCELSQSDLAAIKRYRHSHLLWRYRNSVVHEMREPDPTMENLYESKSEPYYQTWSGDAPSYVHLSYPQHLLEALITEGLTTLRSEWQAQRIDPYKLIPETDDW